MNRLLRVGLQRYSGGGSNYVVLHDGTCVDCIMIIVSDSIYTLYPTGADSIMLMGCYELGVMTLAGAELFQ